MVYQLALAIDARLKMQGFGLVAGIRTILDDWATRGFSKLPGPAVGQIVDFCLAAMDQTAEAAHAVFTSKQVAMDQAEWPHLQATFLAFLESRLHSIAETGLSYAESNPSATHRFQMKRTALLASARRAIGAP